MPIVRLDWVEGYTVEQKTKIMQNITTGISEIVGLDKSRVLVLINDYSFENISKNGEPRSTNNKDGMLCVRFDWAVGKTDEQKKKLIEYITQELNEICGIDKSNVIILFNDIPLPSVGMNGEPRG